jgi:hypothetical protein
MVNVDMGDGASMPMPDNDIEWHLRYGNRQKYALSAASIVAAYNYLVLECSKKEAWRRIKLIRAAYASSHQHPSS